MWEDFFVFLMFEIGVKVFVFELVVLLLCLGVGDIDVGCELNNRIVFWYDWNIVVMYSLIML